MFAEAALRVAGSGFEASMDATPTAATVRSEGPAMAGIPSKPTVARIIIPTNTELERACIPDLRMNPRSLARFGPEARPVLGDVPPPGGTMPTMHRGVP